MKQYSENNKLAESLLEVKKLLKQLSGEDDKTKINLNDEDLKAISIKLKSLADQLELSYQNNRDTKIVYKLASYV